MTADQLAWVPDDSTSPPLNEALDLGVKWVLGLSATRRVRPFLVTEEFDDKEGWEPLERLLAKGDHVTRRSRKQLTPDTGVFLIFGPREELFEFGVKLAGDNPHCVIEFYPFPIDGWARAVGAVDLTKREVLPPFDPDVVNKLTSILSYGNNGWTKGFGADQASRVLRELRESGFDDLNGVVGYAAAQGKFADSLKRLRKLAEEAGFVNHRTLPPGAI